MVRWRTRQLTRWACLALISSLVLVGLVAQAVVVSSVEAKPPRPTPTASTPTPTPTPTPPASLPGTWRTVPPPAGAGRLHGIGIIGPNDIWAVGANLGASLTLHWDGRAWTRIPSPNLERNGFPVAITLHAVGGVAADDVWAVGGTGGDAVILHWDGVAWDVVPVPLPAGDFYTLKGVAAIAADDVWVIGDDAYQTAILHWDGQTWTRVASPNPGTLEFSRNTLNGIAALATDDVWAVGYFTTTGSAPRTLAVHWDGTQWQQVATPGTDELLGVGAASAGDIWAVGSKGQILHWDGAQWQLVPVPTFSSPITLTGVAAVGAADAWAVGYLRGEFFCCSPEDGPTPTFNPLILHWDGVRWSPVAAPNPAPDETPLHAVAAVASDDVWAVGGISAVILRYTVP